MRRIVNLSPPTAPAYIWHNLYLSAVFETDRTQISRCIRQAQEALVCREHELYAIANSAAEREAVVTALNGLHALQICLGPKGVAAAA